MSVKKATVDFVLRDPNDMCHKVSIAQTLVRQELPLLRKQWRASYNAARLKILRNLNTVNPLLAQVLELWHKSFR